VEKLERDPDRVGPSLFLETYPRWLRWDLNSQFTGCHVACFSLPFRSFGTGPNARVEAQMVVCSELGSSARRGGEVRLWRGL